MAIRRQVRGRGPASWLRALVGVVGVSTLLAAAVVAAVAVSGPSSAAHLTVPTKSVASTTGPVTTSPPPSATGTLYQTTTTTLAPPVTTPPTPTTNPALPHFDTPQAAMTYLAAAWNAHDPVALGHVTNPAARAKLDAMHSEAVNLRLDHCDHRPQGDYLCYFHHDYPTAAGSAAAAGGRAIFVVAPALSPGWYMTVVQTCG